ncbi:hypothetical protein JYU34_000054 [Plutella xylostella]|uniref:Reverse transcriptase domain-containing protein n=1 Tax=Plutella xylostella TaxID=51655 RepID=A0ABQ7R6Q8_PLUXY|nr:hypothetical protein JYU34_000054 [Plutella xylostella]
MCNNLNNELDNFSVSESRTCDVEICKRYLTSYKNPFTILTQNIRSISKNFDSFSIMYQVLNTNCDIIIFTECWLTNHNEFLPQIPGYNIHNSKTHYFQNDGVVVYTKNTLCVTVEEPDMEDCNRLLVKIGSEYAILAIYRPPSFKNTDNFTTSLDSTLKTLSSFKTVILTGDININILPEKCTDAGQIYLNLCCFHGLLPAHMLPTHDSGSCLDHIMLKSNRPALALVANSTITDHRTVLLTLNRTLPKQIRTHTISKLNLNKLEEDLCNIDLDPVFKNDDADTCMSYLINNIQQAILKNTSHIKLSNKNCNIKPWITPGLLRCMRHRDKLHMKAKSNPDNAVLQLSYKRYRNFCNKILKKVKIEYEKSELEKAGNNSKKIWKHIKSFTYLSKQHESPSALLHPQAPHVVSANNVNNFFANIGKRLAEKIEKLTPGSNTFPTDNAPLNSFVLINTDMEEVEKIIMSLKDDCAVGWDNISNKILKKFKHILIPPLTYIFQLCLSSGVFPKCLKKAVVVPIHKSGDKTEVTNYRPISLLPAVSKILEKIINNRLMQFLNKNSFLSRTQFGFRPNLSAADAVHELTDYLAQNLDKGNQTIGIFLDLSKAFDTVSIPILLHKLEMLGIRGTQLKLFENYLTERTQCVKIGNVVSSDQENTGFGVPQGSILGPTLFLIYINDLCNLKLENGIILSYADDTALLFSANAENKNLVYDYAQRGFNIVNRWLQHHLLTLNAEKTNFIEFSKQKPKSQLKIPNVYAHYCKSLGYPCTCPTITNTNKTKYLGIIIDETLSFKQHIEALSSRVRKLIFVFKKLRFISDSKIIRQVYFALCQSVLTYCITSWGGSAKTLLLRIERAQRAVLKVSTFRPFRYPTKLLYESCKVLTVRQLFISSIVLKQHTALPYSPELTNKRRVDKDCTIKTTKHALTSRFYLFLGPILYNRLNAKLVLYPLTYTKCKNVLQKSLQEMSYEDTENLLTIVK